MVCVQVVAAREESTKMALIADYGFTFPQRINSKGFIEFSGDIKTLVRKSIYQILGTRLGSRVMVPEFGSRLYELLFEPIDEITTALARVYTIEAIEKWEPRVDLNEVAININPDANRVEIYADYVIINRGIVDSAAVAFPRFVK